jgi:hypothetical protein
MKRIVFFSFLAAAALTAGCQKHKPIALSTSNSEISPSAQSPLAARLDAAKQIGSDDARDDALRVVALDAAKANDAQTATQALQAIGSVNVNEKTAEEIALLFAKAGMPGRAREIAQRIGSNDARDRTLSAIAKGEQAATPTQTAPSPKPQ